jgi:hypothetical protein
MAVRQHLLIEDLTKAASEPQKAAQSVEFAWSPDSRQVTFIAGTDYQQQQLYIVNEARGAVRKIGNFHGALMTLLWSPDGKTLAVLHVETHLGSLARQCRTRVRWDRRAIAHSSNDSL